MHCLFSFDIQAFIRSEALLDTEAGFTASNCVELAQYAISTGRTLVDIIAIIAAVI